MTFFRGQSVVCINDNLGNEYDSPWLRLREWVRSFSFPKKNEIYIVFDIIVGHSQHDGWSDAEIVSSPLTTFLVLEGFDDSFRSEHFRPLVETKTDISVFERIRDRVNAKEIEEISDPVDVSFFAGHP